MRTTAEPPSLIWLALPAVIVPSSSKAARKAPSDSRVVPGRTPSSVSTRIGSPLRCGTATGTISASSRPSLMAVAARSLDFTAKSSCASRPMPPAV